MNNNEKPSDADFSRTARELAPKLEASFHCATKLVDEWVEEKKLDAPKMHSQIEDMDIYAMMAKPVVLTLLRKGTQQYIKGCIREEDDFSKAPSIPPKLNEDY